MQIKHCRSAAIAELVQPHRSDRATMLCYFMAEYLKDVTKYVNTQNWFARFPFDIDLPRKGSIVSLGEQLDTAVADPATSQAHKGVFLQVLKLVRPYLTKGIKEFRDLFRNYEQDAAKFASS